MEPQIIGGQTQFIEGVAATLICCRYIKALSDTITLYYDLLSEHKTGQTRLDRSCDIGLDINVFVKYEPRSTGETSFSYFVFSDR